MVDEEKDPAIASPESDGEDPSLEEGRLDIAEAWSDAARIQELARKREETRKRKLVEEEEAWKDFLKSERHEIKLRQDGQLARMLGKPLPGEVAATLQKLAAHDQMQAERGLVALMAGGFTTYKALEDLRPEDMPARIAAIRLRTTWLKERNDEWLARGESTS
jgi:hypothetical protein